MSLQKTKQVIGETTGRVIFVDAGTLRLTEDSNFHWDNTNKRLGIGTTGPAFRLDVLGNAGFESVAGTTSAGNPHFRVLDGVSTPTATTQLVSSYFEFKTSDTTKANYTVGNVMYANPGSTAASSAIYYASGNSAIYAGVPTYLSDNLRASQNLVYLGSTFSGSAGMITGSFSEFAQGGNAIASDSIAFRANGYSTGNPGNRYYGFALLGGDFGGSFPGATATWGVFIAPQIRNYFGGQVGIGINTNSLASDTTHTLHVNGLMRFEGLTSGATAGYVLTATNAAGDVDWAPVSGGGASKYAETFTPATASVAITITHNLGTADFTVQLWDNTTTEVIYPRISNPATNTVDLTFSNLPSGSVKIIVLG